MSLAVEWVRRRSSHMGADFFPEGRKNASKKITPPKMALGERILFALLGERLRGGRGGQTKFLQKKQGFLWKHKKEKQGLFSNTRALFPLGKPHKKEEENHFFTLSWSNFLEGPLFLAPGEGIGFWTLREGSSPLSPPLAAHVWSSCSSKSHYEKLLYISRFLQDMTSCPSSQSIVSQSHSYFCRLSHRSSGHSKNEERLINWAKEALLGLRNTNIK